MRLAAALIYLSSVAHVAAIGHGFPSIKSTSNFIDVNPAPAGGYSILNQFVKNLKLANLVAGRPTPIASASAPLPTSSASVTVADSVADSTSTGTPDSFVLPLQQLLVNSELTSELTLSPLAADVESPWNLTLPGCATDPSDHVLLSDDVLDSSARDSFILPLQQLLVNSELTPELAPSPLAADVESPWNLTLPGCAMDPYDHGRISSPSWPNPFLYIDDESRRLRGRRVMIGVNTNRVFKALRRFIVSFFETVAISLCLAGNLLEWTLITLPCLGAYLAGLFTLVASIKLLIVVITAAPKMARFAWTPVSTSISVGCMLLFRLLDILRTIVRALLSQLGEDELREHYEMHYEAASKEPPAWLQTSPLHCPSCSCADICQPCCDGTTTPSWRLRTLWRLHFAVSRLDDRLFRAQGRLIHLNIKTNIRREQYLSADYIFHFVYNLACTVARTILHLAPFAILCLILTSRAIFVAAADDDTKRMPIFNGQRDAFVGWFMLFSGYVAWKATDTYQIIDGTETRPAAPATAEEPIVPDAIVGADGVVTNQETINTLTAQRNEWRTQKAKIKDWDERNRKLYGLLLTAMPTWLRTSLYNNHSGNGLDALQYLRTTFDAGSGSGSDHAFHLKRIGESVIEPRREISEDDLRKQYDMQMTAKAAIIRTGKAAPDDATLIAMFDNALPQSYSTIRQLVRRSKHETFLAHYSEYMELVRGELASRRPAPSAYGATVFGSGGNGIDGGGGGGSGGGGGRKGVCLRCGDPSCPGRRKCAKPKTRCPLCGGDHLPSFCLKATGNHRRDELPSGALRLLEKEMAEGLAKREKANAKAALDAKTHKTATDSPGPSSYAAAAAGGTSPSPAAAPSTETEERQRAFAAAAAVAAAEPDRGNFGQVFEAALRSFGFAALHALNAIATPLPCPPSEVAGGAVWAFVDSMSTHFIVPDASMLHTVTNRSPGIGVESARCSRSGSKCSARGARSSPSSSARRTFVSSCRRTQSASTRLTLSSASR